MWRGRSKSPLAKGAAKKKTPPRPKSPKSPSSKSDLTKNATPSAPPLNRAASGPPSAASSQTASSSMRSQSYSLRSSYGESMRSSDLRTSQREDSERIRIREEKISMHSTMQAKKRGKVFGKTLFIMDTTKEEGEGGETAPALPPVEPKTEEERAFLIQTLSGNFIFSGLNHTEINLLVDVMKKEVVEDGTMIIKQGDVGDFFYVVQEGTVSYIVNESMHVGSCMAGGSFGELALLYDAPRAASCVADSEAVLWKVDQNTFRCLLANNANKLERKTSQTLKKIPLFQKLDPAILTKFSNALTTVVFKEGERIMNKGDMGEVFYIIEEGEVRVHDIGYGVDVEDNILKPGEWFGERALLTGEPRVASCTALTDVSTLAMNRETFEMAIGSLEKVLDHEMKKDCLKVLPRFAKSALLPAEINELVYKMTEVRFQKGDKLVEAGKLFARQLFIIRHGKVSVYSESSGVHILMDGDQYGSQFLFDSESKQKKNKSKDTVVVDEDTDCYILTRRDIDRVVGDSTKRLGQHGSYKSRSRGLEIQFKDLQKHRVLGRGAFGLVWLTSHNEDKQHPYALKCMNKVELISAKMVQMTIREKDILDAIDHPFILPLVSSFQDEHNLYLLLKLIQGGELFYVIHNKKKKRSGIPNGSARFYGACVMDALAHFHYRLICYRDLKPENILIDELGYCIVVDLGFAKIVSGKTYTLCGTPDYLAPEILLSKGHDSGVDWWAFGVLVYEMLVGRAPFVERGKDQMAMFRNIVKGRYTFPTHLDPKAEDLISKLLEKNQSKRLGQLARGSLDVKEHPWFRSIDYTKLLKKEIESPWKPEIKDPYDSSHFHEVKEKDKGVQRTLTEEEQDLFKGF